VTVNVNYVLLSNIAPHRNIVRRPVVEGRSRKIPRDKVNLGGAAVDEL
jgi:hypothetical protein